MRILLPHGGPGASFDVEQLVDHLRQTGRRYIVQGQQNCHLADHTKPNSLDVWLRHGFAANHDTKQATNAVLAAIVATGRFALRERLLCPDSGHRAKGLQLVE